MSHQKMTKEARAQLDAMVLEDVRSRYGTSRSLCCGETLRFAAAAAGGGKSKSAIDRALQRLRKLGLISHSKELGWCPVPLCATCKTPLPYGAGVRAKGKSWCSGCAPGNKNEAK